MGSQTVSQIPIIDLTNETLKPGTETWISTCQVMRSALEDNGCFYAMSNKVSMELSNSVFALMDELFRLSLETKKQKTSDKPFHGYYEPHPKVPLYESVGIDDPSNKEAVQKYTNIMWPTGNYRFCETINLYAKLLVEMDQTAKRILFDAYGLDKRRCESFLESTNYMLRSFKYKTPKKTESNLGLHAHTDTSYFTILHQNNITGLQIKLKNGEWIDADPSPNLFLFVAADALMVWSNDRIKACVHKVIISEEKERCSMGLFSLSRKMVETEEKFVDEEHPIRYKAFDHYDYLRYKITSKAEWPIKEFCGIDY
ncbi:hypothetical protein K1719_021541 [Acacia pycnantha]|nr:hypothetical protein K1719_021541 [Acacia pycnantha]